ncbi:HD domain-containing phosphohydrolase [Rhodopirellula sp. MGV]|uniref:HD domain-containing phosphohydrolase n=1 Tax=Rhodopirellula sp. MGV TaxID=2023130 RepID=UPI0013044BF1|nr:HD domain-containing phosphohydrolase [Rhodopirellula sp. MGV]
MGTSRSVGTSRVLVVDDDEKLLRGVVRQQGDSFDISTAKGPREALDQIDPDCPFAVVISDMRMPEMNGVDFLKEVCARSPESVRMIMTGFAELNLIIRAINEGHIFRFLAKPCSEQDMALSLRAGIRQYELVRSEHDLVEGTLHGSVDMLADMLSLVRPLAFGQSVRVRRIVEGLLSRLDIDDAWQVEIAAMLSSLGCVTLPSTLLEKKFMGQPLTSEEQTQFDRHPELASRLLHKIPRLESVGDIIAAQAPGGLQGVQQSPELTRKSKVLRLAFEYERLEKRSKSPLHAMNELRKSAEKFGDELVDALVDYVRQEKHAESRTISIHSLTEGQVLAEELRCSGGTLLMSKGQKITESALRMIENHYQHGAIGDTVKVVSLVSEPKESAVLNA